MSQVVIMLKRLMPDRQSQPSSLAGALPPGGSALVGPVWRRTIVGFAVLLAGCVPTAPSPPSSDLAKPQLSLSQEQQWELMVGRWYGEHPGKEGGKKRWLVERFRDGTYQIEFRLGKADGTTESVMEVGQWAVSGPVYFSSFRGWIRSGELERSDPANPYHYDAYRIVALDDTKFEYEHFATGNRFTVTRVAPDFELR